MKKDKLLSTFGIRSSPISSCFLYITLAPLRSPHIDMLLATEEQHSFSGKDNVFPPAFGRYCEMDDSAGRVGKLDVRMIGDIGEMRKEDLSFTAEDEKKLIRKLDLW